ncbi:endolytic transglycosylase MltG [Celerinatantimonas diazotrophica]|uniref:Endolytic murein transglycosylase n=1 Tax=Celerinatantimonas diazotrophica TaxID=412034 RepID=A0A4R1JAR6_9GAMM|nr:endolytic transglycosylase MltG [Celerinatantimonas diazotrophica]TCK47640.1 UPF0755 protein [Celerinatantimonas diazotrophica]CAG9296737.1 Endolytic murein transglycosylase [Celerinatantimonas diazotrophica]
MRKAFLIISLFLVIGLSGLLFKGYKFAHQLWIKPNLTKSQLYTLKPGERLIDVLSQLTVLNKTQQISLKFWFRIHPKLARIKAGTYELPAQSSFADIAAILRSGKVYQYHLTLVEGETLSQWWQRLSNSPGLIPPQKSPEEIAAQLKAPSTNLEGLLLPETYYYTHGTKAIAVIRRAYHSMEQISSQLWENRDKDLPLTSRYQLIILASLIQKETGINSEMPKVASVFVNRLHKGMRLQTDPTVIYGLGDAYNGHITRADLKAKNAYNTYVIHGLPPTPIAMPGKVALKAAAHPEQTHYYYFVADGTGGHHFSQTLKQHNRAVRKYILNR